MTPPAVFPYESRLTAARERLRARGAAGLVLGPGANLRYLTGYEGRTTERHLLALVPADASADPVLFVPDLEAPDVREATWLPDDAVRSWSDDADPVAELHDALGAAGLAGATGEVCVDDRLWATFVQDLRDCLDAPLGLASDVLGLLRRTKDDAEVAAMREAGAIADAVAAAVRTWDLVGRTERDVAWEIRRELADRGGEGEPFEPVVAAGPNGARPHHAFGDREIREGDPVVLDFGTRVDGYASDQTRTIVPAGDPGERFREVHAVVREAQTAAVDAVEPGVTAGEVDAAAREVIADAGYGDAFLHRTGHGVGLETHEAPYIASGSAVTLEPGMVFSVEPGVYLDGAFGVRIEDLVVVTERGCERLNDTDRGW